MVVLLLRYDTIWHSLLERRQAVRCGENGVWPYDCASARVEPSLGGPLPQRDHPRVLAVAGELAPGNHVSRGLILKYAAG